MASDVEICNRALRQLGAIRITSLTGDSKEARACNDVFASVRRALLRSSTWNFAIKRVKLAALTSTPAWGFDNEFALPSDSIKILEVDGFQDDEWAVEGNKIVSQEATELDVKYLADVEDANLFDDLFIDCFAARLALELCETLTQSNTKKTAAREWYTERIRVARLHDAIEGTPTVQEESAWIDAIG